MAKLIRMKETTRVGAALLREGTLQNLADESVSDALIAEGKAESAEPKRKAKKKARKKTTKTTKPETDKG